MILLQQKHEGLQLFYDAEKNKAYTSLLYHKSTSDNAFITLDLLKVFQIPTTCQLNIWILFITGNMNQSSNEINLIKNQRHFCL